MYYHGFPESIRTTDVQEFCMLLSCYASSDRRLKEVILFYSNFPVFSVSEFFIPHPQTRLIQVAFNLGMKILRVLIFRFSTIRQKKVFVNNNFCKTFLSTKIYPGGEIVNTYIACRIFLVKCRCGKDIASDTFPGITHQFIL